MQRLPIPPRVHLMLAQYGGLPSLPVVRVGQKVRKGELIATAQGGNSAPLHASTSGIVSGIGPITAPHASGAPGMAISIDADGEDTWIETTVPADPYGLSPERIASLVAAAGVWGLAEISFPPSMQAGDRPEIDTLIVNGRGCEPWLSCDQRLMRDKADDIVSGIRLMLISTGARCARVDIDDNQPEAITAMREAVRGCRDIAVLPVAARYPVGSERQLSAELSGREMPSAARPAEVGVIVHDVGTAYAVHQAVCRGRPLVSRLLTLNGGAATEPGNYEVPLGTLVSDLVAFTGGPKGKPAQLVMWGTKREGILPHLQVPVVKDTRGILLLDARERTETAAAPRAANTVLVNHSAGGAASAAA